MISPPASFPHNTQRLPPGLATAVTTAPFKTAGLVVGIVDHLDDLLADIDLHHVRAWIVSFFLCMPSPPSSMRMHAYSEHA